MNVLIVEDETRLADALGQILKEEKHQVTVVYDGRDGLEYGLTGSFDVIILDVMLPYMDGFEVVRRLRSHHVKTPVLMLTAKDQLINKIEGLDSGADDYMTKPFEMQELLARVRALGRRTGDVTMDTMQYGDLELNMETMELSCGAKSLSLSQKEFLVLKILMAHKETIVSKEELINKVWGPDSDAEGNNVEAYISFLRKKIAFVGSKVQITMVRRVGYHLEE
ncbi:MAG TPA: DNA-binding response regulator [Lachnospiraceae bacterium]|jgi:DNA-binding response OmpR family regulator|nr:DNA-binding response regulator [Lachnospiraceae bacterium]